MALPLGPRALGMGGAQAALATDATASTWNPAGLAWMPARAFHGMSVYQRDLAGTDYGYFLNAWSPRPGLGLGLWWGTLQTGRVEFFDPQGEKHEEPGESDNAAGLALGLRLPWNLGLGVGGKYLDSRIGRGFRASSLAADFSLRASWPGRRQALSLALVRQNAFGRQRFVESSVRIREYWRGGLALGQRVSTWGLGTLALDMNLRPGSSDPRWNLGGEFSFQPRNSDFQVSLRGGLGLAYALKGFQAGAGLRFNSLELDYALAEAGLFGLVHRLSLGLRLGFPSSSEAKENPALVPEAKALRPAETPSPTPTAGAAAPNYKGWGDKYFQEKNYGQAAAYYSAALQQEPGCLSCRRAYAYCLFDQGRVPESLEIFRQVLAQDPGDEALRDWLRHVEGEKPGPSVP